MSDGPLDHLIRILSGLPGLGNRSARRIALHMLDKRGAVMMPLSQALKQAAEEIKDCEHCGNLDMVSPCGICRDHKRDRSKLCVVAQVSDVWAIERTGAFKGHYHVLGGLLSALDGIGPSDLRIESLIDRVAEGGDIMPDVIPNVEQDGANLQHFEEVILGLSATVDGQSTAHYIADRLAKYDVKLTRLAHGVPIGGELDYLDDGTIVTALNSRSAA